MKRNKKKKRWWISPEAGCWIGCIIMFISAIIGIAAIFGLATKIFKWIAF